MVWTIPTKLEGLRLNLRNIYHFWEWRGAEAGLRLGQSKAGAGQAKARAGQEKLGHTCQLANNASQQERNSRSSRKRPKY